MAMRWLRAALRRITVVFAVFGSVAACVLMIAICVDVVVRGITGGSVPGMVELSEASLVCVVFFGLGYAEHTRQHIATTIVSSRIPVRVARWNRVISYLIVSIVVVWLTYESVLRAIESLEQGEYHAGLTEWPLWPARFAVAVGLFLLSGNCVVRLIDCTRAALGRTAAEEDAAVEESHKPVL